MPPKRRPVWQTFRPCVTQLDCTFSKLLEEDTGDGQSLQIFDSSGLVPAASAQCRVLRLERPGNECGEAASFFLQIVDALEVVDPIFISFADAEHHSGGSPHAELMCGAVHIEPIVSEAFEARDFVADFVVENFSAATRNGIKSGITQAADGVFDAQAADIGDANNLRGGEAMQMHLREALLQATQEGLVPVNLQVGMQSALQQNAGAAQLHSLAHFVVDGLEIEDVSLCCQFALERAIESAESTIFSAEVGVVDVAVDNVRDHALGMEFAPHRIGFHADADQVIRTVHLERLSLG